MTTKNSAEVVDTGAEAVASFSSRFMALTIDLVLLFFFMALFVVCTGKGLAGILDGVTDPLVFFHVAGNWGLGVLVCGIAASGGFFCLIPAWCGRTIGKQVMGIRLITCDGDGLDLGLCFLRLVGYLVSFLPLFFGFFWALLDIEGRAWHDRLAGTKVLYE